MTDRDRCHPHFIPLDQLTDLEAPHAGGKASACARLKQAAFPVPDGLVILASASEVDIARLPEDPWIRAHAADAAFAVRSSGLQEDTADQSFAGLHETRLDVPRGGLIDAVRAVRASARSARALAYRRSKGLPADQTAMGVLVQRMIHAEAAGVAFSINPLTGSRDEVVINAAWGVGDALVSGLIDPDEFYVRKGDHAVFRSRIGVKGPGGPPGPSLAPAQPAELAATVEAIERREGAPVDVEWCHDGRQFWVVQARPVTAVRTHAPDMAARGIEWTRANFAEVLPDLPCPQAVAVLENLLNRAERRYMGRLVAPERVLGPMVKAFEGRLYFNLSQLRHICVIGRTPAALALKAMGHAGPITPEDEDLETPTLGGLLRAAPDLIRLTIAHLRIASTVRKHESRVRDAVAHWSAIDARTLSDTHVLTAIERWLDEAPKEMQVILTLGGVLFHEAPLHRICTKVGFSFERLLFSHLAAGERLVSASQAFDLIELARVAREEPAATAVLAREPVDVAGLPAALAGTAFLTAFEQFLARYGHRGRYETDWSLPRYNEDATPLWLAIRAHLQQPGSGNRRLEAAAAGDEAAAARREFVQRLTMWQRWTLLPRVDKAIRTIKKYYLWREQCRSDAVRVIGIIRRWHLVLADRFVERGWLATRDDYFLLYVSEIAETIRRTRSPETLRGLVDARATERQRQRRLTMPLLMRESELPDLIRTAGLSDAETSADRLTGHGVSGGCVEADVVVLQDPSDVAVMKRGAILVARATDPSWTPLFTLASGVIVEVGGVLSHASTIAREFGLPAVANVHQATKRLKTGDRVRLDADNGVVYRLASR